MTIDNDTAHGEPMTGQPQSPGHAAEPVDDRPPMEAVQPRAMIAVAALAAHPGNVRADLDLNEEFVNSIAANGVLVALRITPDGVGFRVIDGGRRLAAAVKTGTEQVPVDLVAERAGDEAGQYLDMITANRHRNPLMPLEEADALFAARKAGAPRTRLRKATGMSAAAVTGALAAARLGEEARSRVAGLEEQLTLDQYALLAEFQDDPEATGRLLAVAGRGGSLDHEAERIRQQRAERADHERLVAELAAAGYHVAATTLESDQLLAVLLHDGEDLTPQAHAACPGRGVFFRAWDLHTPVHYCCDPAGYGHTSRYASPASPPAPDGGEPAPAGSSAEEPPDPSRRIVIEGNKAWAAATEVRRRWLATVFARRTAPRELTQFVARQLLTMPEPARSGLARAHAQMLFSQLTGHSETEWLTISDTAPAARLPLVMFAPIATAFESAMGEGEGRNTWRTGRYSPCPREQAAAYLTLLATLGYQPSVIEQAVAGQRPYTGEAPPGQAAIDEATQPGTPAGGGPEAEASGTGPADEPETGQDQASAAGEPGEEPDSGASGGQAAA